MKKISDYLFAIINYIDIFYLWFCIIYICYSAWRELCNNIPRERFLQLRNFLKRLIEFKEVNRIKDVKSLAQNFTFSNYDDLKIEIVIESSVIRIASYT